MEALYTTCGQLILVDDVDFAWARHFQWSLSGYGYPKYHAKGKTIYLHKEIAKRLKLIGKIDHKNRDKLDCCHKNLREVTKSQNAMNSKIRSDNITGVTGVCYSVRDKRYIAQISVDGKHILLGYFKTIEEAIAVRRAAEIKYFGEFAPNHED